MEASDPYREDLPGNKKETASKKALELGYQSDSEDDSADSDHDKAQQNQDDEATKNDDDDDDMFASDNEGGKEVPKNPNLLDLQRFEEEQGLENTSQAETKVYGNSEIQQIQNYYANIENHEPGQRREPLREVQLEAFNLKDEAEHGTFDKDMNYTRGTNSDEETAEDAWMNGVEAEDIEKARKAQESSRKASKMQVPARDTGDLLQRTVEILEPAETALEALARLSPPKKRRGAALGEKEKTRRETVVELTECCEQLLNQKGVRDVYDMSREELMRMYKRETGQDLQIHGQKRKADALEETGPDYGEAIWEFRWLGEPDINGPYSSYEMKYWVENYFDNKVEVRKKGSDHFVHVQNVHFDA